LDFVMISLYSFVSCPRHNLLIPYMNLFSIWSIATWYKTASSMQDLRPKNMTWSWIFLLDTRPFIVF
jgi:hypothetical protein